MRTLSSRVNVIAEEANHFVAKLVSVALLFIMTNIARESFIAADKDGFVISLEVFAFVDESGFLFLLFLLIAEWQISSDNLLTLR